MICIVILKTVLSLLVGKTETQLEASVFSNVKFEVPRLPLFGVGAAIYKRTTMQVFKAHGMVQARIIDCASETFAAIRTVSPCPNPCLLLGPCFDPVVLLVRPFFCSFIYLFKGV